MNSITPKYGSPSGKNNTAPGSSLTTLCFIQKARKTARTSACPGCLSCSAPYSVCAFFYCFFQPVPTASNMILRKCWKFFRSTNRYCPCFPTFQHNFLNRGLYILFLFFYIPLYRRWKCKNVGNSPLTLLVKENFFQHTSNILYFVLEVFTRLLPAVVYGAFS